MVVSEADTRHVDPIGRAVATRAKAILRRAPVSTIMLDLALVAAAITPLITESVVIWFHVIFVLLAVAALVLSFRGFVIRLVIWMSVATGLVIWGVTSLDIPADELNELPLLTLVLIIVFMVAQQRTRAANERELAHRALSERMDLELEGLREQLKQSQRLEVLGRASTGLAHDLRNVFVIIQGCSAEPEGRSAHDLSENLSAVHAASERAMSMLDDLLLLGRQDATAGGEVELATALAQIEPLLAHLVGSGTKLEVAVAEPLCVAIDRISLAQILMNLVANANDAIDDGGRIVIRARGVATQRPGQASERCAILTVADDGGGFDPAVIDRAFESGFTTKGVEHNGLGLATVSQIVDRAGGTVRIESSPSFTSIAIHLPLVHAHPRNGHGVDGSNRIEAVPAIRSVSTTVNDGV
jgi:signal transduction histidine kinase